MEYKSFTDCVDFVGTACQPFDGEKKYISTGAVDIDHISECDIEMVDFDGRPSRANLQVKPGDILFAKMQSTKKTLAIDETLSNNVYSTGFCAVKTKKGVLTDRCLYHLLTSDAFLSQKDKNCSGATQKAITNTGLEKIIIRVPDYSMQDDIAKQLDIASSVIQKRKQEIQSLDNLIKARFVEMFGDPETNPKNWEKRPLTDVITAANNGMARRGNDEDGNIVMRLVELQDGYIDYSKPNRIILTEVEKKRYLLKDKDFLFARVNGNPENVGRCAVFYDIGEPVFHNDHIIRVHFDDDNLDGPFASALLNSEYGKRQLRNQIKTSAGQYTVSQDGIGAIVAILPPIEIQRQFAAFVGQVDKSKVVVQNALNEAQLLFDSLMQQYFG